MKQYVGRAFSHRLFWPVVMLVALLAINVIAVPGFLSITVNSDGHLFGSLIDIVRNGAPTLIIAVGMTLVIATRGIDLSVGSVCAISGAVACSIILGSPNPDDPAVVGVAVLAALGLVAADGGVERLPRRRPRHPADHRDPDPDDRRTRHRDADHRGQHPHRGERALQVPRLRLRARHPGRDRSPAR